MQTLQKKPEILKTLMNVNSMNHEEYEFETSLLQGNDHKLHWHIELNIISINFFVTSYTVNHLSKNWNRQIFEKLHRDCPI